MYDISSLRVKTFGRIISEMVEVFVEFSSLVIKK